MTELTDYMAAHYKMEIEQDADEGGYVVSFPDLPGCITCSDTLEGAIAAAEDAKQEWITAAIEEGIDIPVIQCGRTSKARSFPYKRTTPRAARYC